MNLLVKIKNSSTVLCKFGMDAVVLDIGNRNIILWLSWMIEKRFSVDIQDRCLRNDNSSYIISCSVR